MPYASIAVYPGTFDPLTNGHIDLVKRTVNIFPRVIVAVAKATGAQKQPLFSFTERVTLAQQVFEDISSVQVVGFDRLLVDFMEEVQASVLIRGLRAVSDFEYEFQMASVNRHLNPHIETVFLTPSEQYAFVSSTMVKEAARLGGNVSALLHPVVHQALRAKYDQ